MNEVRERMGLRVTHVTLKTDWNKDGTLADIMGSVQILITDRCVLQPDIIGEIAELIAAEVAETTLEDGILIEGWKVERNGDRLEVTAQQFRDLDFTTARPSRHFNEHAADVRPVNGW